LRRGKANSYILREAAPMDLAVHFVNLKSFVSKDLGLRDHPSFHLMNLPPVEVGAEPTGSLFSLWQCAHLHVRPEFTVLSQTQRGKGENLV
jgi:hypothetical protein